MNKPLSSKKFHLSIGVISVILLVIFTLQNSEVVTINILFWAIEMSRVIMIMGLLFIGFILGYIFHGVRKR